MHNLIRGFSLKFFTLLFSFVFTWLFHLNIIVLVYLITRRRIHLKQTTGPSATTKPNASRSSGVTTIKIISNHGNATSDSISFFLTPVKLIAFLLHLSHQLVELGVVLRMNLQDRPLHQSTMSASTRHNHITYIVCEFMEQDFLDAKDKDKRIVARRSRGLTSNRHQCSLLPQKLAEPKQIISPQSKQDLLAFVLVETEDADRIHAHFAVRVHLR